MENKQKKLISFSIPCYRSEDTIESVINEITHMMNMRSDGYDYEVVAAVDGSPDNVIDVLKNLARDNKRIKIINLSKNYGQASARMASLTYTKGDYVVCLDDDGQCPVDKLWELFEPMEKEFDVSIAVYPQKKQSKFKNFGSFLNKIMVRYLLDASKNFSMSNFFILKRYVVDEMVKYTNPYPYMTGLMLRITKKFAFVGMEERERLTGKTGYTLKKLVGLWMNGFTTFSVKPLRVSSFIGALCAVSGFVYGFIVIIKRWAGVHVEVGWTTIISLLLFLGGLIMLMLGMIGEYIGRIYICINKSPQYVVKETINLNEILEE